MRNGRVTDADQASQGLVAQERFAPGGGEIPLEERERRLRLAIDAAGIGTWEYDLQQRRLQWDGRMHRLHHLDHSTARVDLPAWRDRVHPADRFRAIRTMLRAAPLGSALPHTTAGVVTLWRVPPPAHARQVRPRRRDRGLVPGRCLLRYDQPSTGVSAGRTACAL